MPTTQVSPLFGVDTARDIVKNNERIVGVDFILHTDETWLPLVLSQIGFFTSNGEVKRNKPEFWRDVVHGETINLSWARVMICVHGKDSALGVPRPDRHSS
jgi:hypothetical protein